MTQVATTKKPKIYIFSHPFSPFVGMCTYDYVYMYKYILYNNNNDNRNRMR